MPHFCRFFLQPVLAVRARSLEPRLGSLGTDGETNLPSVRILLVDDHATVRQHVRELLQTHANWTICGEAADGIEAVEKAAELRPDLVVMDISMPRASGLDATRQILREFPQCSVIILTQNEPAVARMQAEAVHAAGFVAKSDLRKKLVPTLERTVEHRKSAAEDSPEKSTTGEWLAGGELGRLIQEFDWSSTPLGPMEEWPSSLKTIVRVLETSRFAMWMGWGEELTFFYNDAYAKMSLGKKHPWALGKPSNQVWAEIWGDIGPRIQQVLKSGVATWDEALLLFLERSGYREETYHTFSYSPLPDDDGKILGHLCVVTEDTERVIGERRLKTLRSLATELNSTISERDVCAAITSSLHENQKDLPFTLTYLFAADGQQAQLVCASGIEPGHPAAPDVLHLRASNQVWPISDVHSRKASVAVEDLAARFESIPSGFWDKPATRALLVPITSQGQETPAGVLIAGLNPFRQLDDDYAGFIHLVAGQIAASIANARAYEQEKKRAEALAEIDRAKTAFFSNVSHEFRTPLTLMLGPLQDLLFRSQTHLSPMAKDQLELANRNGARLLRLVNTLLDFSRIEAGRVQGVYEATDLAAFTAELGSVFRSATEKAGLKLIVDCQPLREVAYVDREMWEKIVLNLISNAFKFTFEGQISVLLRQVGDTAELRVTDTGVGIPEEEIPNLFLRFHRIPNSRSRTHEGSGIGLSLVHELIKLHHGTVRVESAVGKGSTFIVTIPLGRELMTANQPASDRPLSLAVLRVTPFVQEALRWLPAAESAAPAPEIAAELEMMGVPQPMAAPESAAGRPFVLVADDNADMRLYLARLLSEHFEVAAVSNGKAALEAVRRRIPDLLLSDVMMPELDGFGLLREFRGKPETRTIPIILLSAKAGEESRVEGLDAGADDYLVKPFSARELVARVQNQLQLAHVRAEAARSVRESESKLQMSLKASRMGVFYWYPDEDRTEADARVLEMFGLSSSEELSLASALGEMIHPDDRDKYAGAVARAIDPNLDGKLEQEIRIRLKDGSERWLSVTAQLQFDGKPLRATRMAGMIGDITERKRTEEAVRRQSAQYETLLNQAPIGVYLIDAQLRVRDVNPTAARVFNNVPDLIGRDFEEVIKILWPQPYADELIAIFRHTLATGQAYQSPEWSEHRLDRDSTEYYSWRVDRIPLPEGGFGVVCYFQDISDQVRARNAISESEERFRRLAETLESEVRNRTRELEQRNTELSEQAGVVQSLSRSLMSVQDEEKRHIARELHDSAGQTLAVLNMALATLAEHARGGDAQLLGEIAEAQGVVSQLTQEIRTTSYLLHPPMLDEIGVAAALKWYAKGVEERSGITISLDVPDDLDRFSREAELVAFRVVQECLTNIHRHSGSRSAAIRIAVSGETISVQVTDSGKGMSPERLAEIRSNASGVGIRGMRERVRQLGGQMNIESGEFGTSVTVRLPAALVVSESVPRMSGAPQRLSTPD
jgi:PAS domain S-box-containing protein